MPKATTEKVIENRFEDSKHPEAHVEASKHVVLEILLLMREWELNPQSRTPTPAASRQPKLPTFGDIWIVMALKQTYFQHEAESAVCVQHSIDSRNTAIHRAYRILLRPSSLLEPRHPSLKVVIEYIGWLYNKEY